MIDWDRVAELKTEVGEDDFAEVAEMFFTELEEVIGRLDPTDAGALASDLHFLKGSALNIGLSDVSRLCLEVETRLRCGEDVARAIGSIRDAFFDSRRAFFG